MLQARVAVVEGDRAVASLIEMDFGPGEAEALALLGDLKALALPLDDVVVAHHALVNEAADAVQIFRSRTPGSWHFAGAVSEAAVVVGKEGAEHGVGGIQIAGLSQAQKSAQGFAAEGEALDLTEFFAEVMIVEAGIGGACQKSRLGAREWAGGAGWAVRGWRAPEPRSVTARTFLKTFYVSFAEREQFGGSGARHVSLNAARYYVHSL